MYQTNVFSGDEESNFQGDTNFPNHVKTLLQFGPHLLTQVNKELFFFVNIADLFSMSNKVEYGCKRGNKKESFISFKMCCWKVRYPVNARLMSASPWAPLQPVQIEWMEASTS